jgi:hypothetical protein
VLRGIFGPKIDEVRRDCREMYIDELDNLLRITGFSDFVHRPVF